MPSSIVKVSNRLIDRALKEPAHIIDIRSRGLEFTNDKGSEAGSSPPKTTIRSILAVVSGSRISHEILRLIDDEGCARRRDNTISRRFSIKTRSSTELITLCEFRLK